MCSKSAKLLLVAGCLGACAESPDPQPQAAPAGNLATAEALIDAFYSFQPEMLESFLVHPQARASAPALMFYQGWAEGGNYKVIQRTPCTAVSENVVQCAITVEDDPVLALKTNFNVTDTFTITFDAGQVVKVETDSNDQPIYYQAFDWVVKEMPEVMDGPCKGFFDGGPTPGDCARAMTEGYRRFAASEEYPL